jgi:hypothetical protein
MSDYTYTNVEIVARLVPDTSVEPGADGVNQVVQLPGFIDLYAIIDGVPLFIQRSKAGKLLQRIEALQNSTPPPAPAAPTDQPQA